MQPLTRQELQTAVQQLRNAILGQAATKQDLSKAMTTMSQQTATQVDVQQVLNQCTDRIIARADQAFKQQNALMQQLASKLDNNAKRLSLIEDRQYRLEQAIRDVGLGVAQHDRASENRSAAAQAREEALVESKFAQKTAFGGLFG